MQEEQKLREFLPDVESALLFDIARELATADDGLSLAIRIIEQSEPESETEASEPEASETEASESTPCVQPEPRAETEQAPSPWPNGHASNKRTCPFNPILTRDLLLVIGSKSMTASQVMAGLEEAGLARTSSNMRGYISSALSQGYTYGLLERKSRGSYQKRADITEFLSLQLQLNEPRFSTHLLAQALGHTEAYLGPVLAALAKAQVVGSESPGNWIINFGMVAKLFPDTAPPPTTTTGNDDLLTFFMDEPSASALSDAPDEESEAGISPRILKVLDSGAVEGLSRQDIAAALKVEVSRVSSALANLRRWGWVNNDDQVWRRTAKRGPFTAAGGHTEQDPKIVTYILTRKDFTTADLARHLNRSGSGLSSSLTSLARRNLIIKASSGGWQVDRHEAKRLKTLGWHRWFREADV